MTEYKCAEQVVEADYNLQTVVRTQERFDNQYFDNFDYTDLCFDNLGCNWAAVAQDLKWGIVLF